jgi:hypothetical protein
LGETSREVAGNEIDCEIAEWKSQEEVVIQWLDSINMAKDVRVFFFVNMAKNMGGFVNMTMNVGFWSIW